MVLKSHPRRASAVARWYVGGLFSVENYANSLRQLGFDEADLAQGGSDRLIDVVAAWGDLDVIAGRVQAHLDARADHVALQSIDVTLEAPLAAIRPSLPTHARP